MPRKSKSPLDQLVDVIFDELVRMAKDHVKNAAAQATQQRRWPLPNEIALAQAYATLGVDTTATDDEVKAAYRKLAGVYHPDRVAMESAEAQAEATRRFQVVQAAWEAVRSARGLR